MVYVHLPLKYTLLWYIITLTPIVMRSIVFKSNYNSTIDIILLLFNNLIFILALTLVTRLV